MVTSLGLVFQNGRQSLANAWEIGDTDNPEAQLGDLTLRGIDPCLFERVGRKFSAYICHVRLYLVRSNPSQLYVRRPRTPSYPSKRSGISRVSVRRYLAVWNLFHWRDHHTDCPPRKAME